MPFISNSVTVSGEFNIGAVEIEDTDSAMRAHVTQAGLQVDTGDQSRIGISTYQIIDATSRRLDCTPLAVGSGYPMDVELEAQFAPCYIFQGASTVTLPAGHLKRIRENEWQMVTISGVDEAYFAIVRESSSTASGILCATRCDRWGF